MKKAYIEQIRRGEKTVEGRVFAARLTHYRVGDKVRFYYYTKASDDVVCRIARIQWFRSFSAMLEAVGFNKCIPTAKTLQEAIAAYENIAGYKEKAQIRGVTALYLETVHLS